MATTTKKSKPKTAKRLTLGSLAIEALTQAVAFKVGKRTGAKLVKVTARRAQAEPVPEFELGHVARIRGHLGLSQPVFAHALNVSAGPVKAGSRG